MSSPGELEARVARLEQEVAQLRERAALTDEDAGAARVLASGADRDVSEVRAELRAHSRALNALRETQLELAAAQQEMRRELSGEINGLSGEIDGLRGEMRSGFAEMRVGMSRIVTLLGGPAAAD